MNKSHYITLLDYAILPIILALVYGHAYYVRNKKYAPSHPWFKYFIPALSVKIFGAIFIGMVYEYYYGGGDTFNFFYHTEVIFSSLKDSPVKFINLLFQIPSSTDIDYYQYTSQMRWYTADSSYTVAAIAAVFSLLTFNTYLPTAVLFAYLSFTGIWALFRTFAPIYPKLTHPIAISILFVPSVFVWGSGLFKDTICIFGLGWLTYGVFRFLVKKDFGLQNIILTTLSFILIYRIKLYILMAFTPALMLWVMFNYTQKINNSGLKFFVKLSVIALTLLTSYFLIGKFGEELGRYSLDNIVETSLTTQSWILKKSGDDGSGYTLGSYDPSIQGMLLKFPLAVNVTLFRPYIWEAKKVIVMLSSLEAMLFLWLTLKVIFSIGIKKVWKTISTDANIQFSLIFTIIFAFAVGISTYNFGTLSRYKIPCIPFFALSLVLIYYKNAPKGSRLLGKIL